jgi:hypothetical protein
VERPAGLTAVAVLLMVVTATTLAALLTVIPTGSFGTQIFAMLCAAGILVIIRRFRNGRNSARLFLMALSGFLVLNALMDARVDHGTYLYMIFLAAVGVFLLFYLNRHEVRTWFKSQNEAPSRKGELQKPGIGRSK